MQATQSSPLLDLCAEDVMHRDVVIMPRRTSLRDTARILCKRATNFAAVVDESGRCVGSVSAVELLRWMEQGHPDAEATTSSIPPTCPYQVQGRLLTGECAIVCTLPEGSCPLQVSRATTGGRHTSLCLQPQGILSDWQVAPELPEVAIERYVKPEVTTITLWTPLSEMLRMMVESHVPSFFVVDEEHRPVGVVNSSDILAAVAWNILSPTT